MEEGEEVKEISRDRHCIKFPIRAEARDFLPLPSSFLPSNCSQGADPFPPTLTPPASLQLGSNFSAERKRELREACEQTSKIFAIARD